MGGCWRKGYDIQAGGDGTEPEELTSWSEYCGVTSENPKKDAGCAKWGIVNIDCQVGKGLDYQGDKSYAKSGKKCQKWNRKQWLWSDPTHDWSHNKCRNPDGEDGAWCYVKKGWFGKKKELCDIRQCSDCDKEKDSQCPNGYLVTMVVKTRLRQQSVADAFVYTERIRSTSAYRKKLKDLSADGAIGGKLKGFSAKAQYAFNLMSDSVSKNEQNSKDVEDKKITFHPDYLQIFKDEIIRTSIDGKSAIMTTSKKYTTVNVKEPWSFQQLRDEANKYMRKQYPDEKIIRNAFVKTACVQG